MNRLVMLLVAAWLAPGPDPRIGWRGDGSGSFPDAAPPLQWSAKGENLVWKTAMPDRSNSGPILVGDRVFTCGEPSTLHCVSALDGKILWSNATTFFDAEPEDPEAAALVTRWNAARSEGEKRTLRKELRRSDYFEMPPVMGEHFGFFLEYTLPTPASDGKHVYVVYGTGLAASYDLDGRRRWARGIEKPSSPTGYASSPLLAGGRLIVSIGGSVLGLDPATGKTAWSADYKECYGSPVRMTLGDTDLVVLPRGDIFRASDGKKLASGAAVNVYQSSVVQGDVVYSMRDDPFSEEDASSRMMAVRLKPAPEGGLVTEKLWESTAKSGYSSPLCSEGLLYTSKNKIGVVAFDAATGAQVYAARLNHGGGENYPCIARAGAYLYVPSQNGKIAVLQPGREFKQLAMNDLSSPGDQLVGPLFFSGKRLYVRTHKFLYCIGAGS
jgi:outer membrane protein assembly factor BamB